MLQAPAAFLIALCALIFACGTAKSPTVVLIKVGGSSITQKADKETLNYVALEWFVRIVKDASQQGIAFVVVHGAGSFGHHTAKEYGLRGKTEPPNPNDEEVLADSSRRKLMLGLGRTRLSVRQLNQDIISAFLGQDVAAVGISPCFGVPGMNAHGGGDSAKLFLREAVEESLAAGLIPVLHGDAGLYGKYGAGILSGDTVMEILGQAPWVSHVVFLTDVDGVFTADPNMDESAVLIRTLNVDTASAEITSTDVLNATGSTHKHDVTGGLKVRNRSMYVRRRMRYFKHSTNRKVQTLRGRPNSRPRHPSPQGVRM